MPNRDNNRRPIRRSRSARSWPISRIGTAIVVLFFIAVGIYVMQRSVGGKKQPLAENGAASTAAATVVPRSGGTLVEGDVGLPATLNPLLASSQTERDLAKLLFAGLIRVDGSGKPLPDLAQKWDVSSDGRTYTITLKPGLTWHDGAPFDSHDVRFTIGLIQSPNFPGSTQLSRFWRPVVVDTPDDNTVVFHLMDPFSPFLNYLNLPILPKHILGGVLAQDLTNDPFNLSPVGTGPFSLVSFDRDTKEVKLKAFTGYSGKRPMLDKMTIQYFDDGAKLLAALKGGSVQATGTLPADELLRTGALSRQDSVYAPLLMSYTALFFNTRIAPFSNQVVRQALQMAIDSSELTNGPLKSQAVAGSSPIPGTSWAFSAQNVAFNPSEATSILEKAGWKYVEEDGVLENGGSRLEFQLLVNADDPQRLLMAQSIAQQLGNIHVRVSIQPATSEAVGQALTARQFSAAMFGGHYVNGDPDCLDVWHSTESSNGLNVTGINDPVMDKALLDARGTSDFDKRRQLYARFQQEFVNQAPAIVLYYPRYLFVVSSEIGGVKPDPMVDPSDRFLQISSWFFASQLVPGSKP